MANEYKTIKCRLDGKQTVSIPVHIKQNGRYVTEPLDIIVRGFLKFSGVSNVEDANVLEDKTVVYPVLFTTDRIRINDGRCAITLLPRAEDLFEITQSLEASASISNEDIFSQGGVRADEQITSPGKEPVVIRITTNVIRDPYKLSIEVTALSVFSSNLYSNTIDRGTSPQIEEMTDVKSLFQKEKSRAASNIIIDCYNDMDWIPVVDSILGDNDSSMATILEEIDKLQNHTSFGASTMYDAVVAGARILSDNTLEDLRKTIYLFTDNESNISMASLDNAIEEVNDIDGNKNVPVLISNMAVVEPSTLSVKANMSDTKSINKLSFLTGGQALTITDATYQNDIVGIFYREVVGAMGYGTYEFVVDMEDDVLVNHISVFFDIATAGSNATWNIETSADGYNYTALNADYTYADSVDFSNLYARYIRFKIVLITAINSIADEYGAYPESPALTSVQILYNAHKIAYLYLNKEDVDIQSYQMVMAVDANDVNDGQIEVGVAKSDSINWSDFSTDSQPVVNQNGKIVIPIRFSQDVEEFQQEPLSKVDIFTLKTEYGSFDPYAAVILYDASDEIIPSNYYVLNHREGMVIFNYALPSDYSDGDYKIGIINQGEYKVGIKFTNKTKDTEIEMYGVGYLYTTGKDLLPPLGKTAPEAQLVFIVNETPNKFSIIEASYTYYDSNFEPEDTTARRIKWFINGVPVNYLEGLTRWNDITDLSDPLYVNTALTYPVELPSGETLDTWIKKQSISILHADDKVHFEIQVSDGTLFSEKTKSADVVIIGTTPVMDQITVMARDDSGNLSNRLTSNQNAVIYPPVDTIFFADSDENQSEIIWYVNDEIFKRGIYGEEAVGLYPIHEIGVNEVGRENYMDYGLRIGNSIVVQIIPRADGISGDPVTSSIENNVVQNCYPKIFNSAYVNSVYDVNSDVVLTWDFYDFEIHGIGDVDSTNQSDQTGVKWYRKKSDDGDDVAAELVYSYNDQDSNLPEIFHVKEYMGHITTSLGTHTSIIDDDILVVGQRWYAEIIPHDTLDAGETTRMSLITITSSV